SAQQLGILGCTAAQISAANQADPANQVAIQLGRRNIEGGARTSDYEHTNYRAVIGVKGDLTKAWRYDAWGQYYYTTFFNSNDQYFNYANIDNALVVTGTRANPQCVVGAPCVPWNIFQDGGVTPAALAYLYSNGTGSGNTTLRTAHADITGELGEYGVKLPTANEGLGMNVGFEHRNENVQFTPDSIEQTGQLAGFGGAAVAINNSLAVDEEIIELYNPQLLGLIQFGNDPCAPPVQAGVTLAQCLHTVPASQAAAFTTAFNNGTIPQAVAGQLGQVQGGNPLLQPEKAKSYSLGLLFAPQAVPSLTGSVDFWQIRLDQVVGPLPASVALKQCLATGNPTYCAVIV